MPKSNSKEQAHQSMRKLWEVVDGTLRDPDVIELPTQNEKVRQIETPGGATVVSYAGIVTVSAEFVRFGDDNDSEEVIEVVFPEDIRDLSQSTVSIHWCDGPRKGTDTPSLQEFPEIAEQLLDCLQARRAS